MKTLSKTIIASLVLFTSSSYGVSMATCAGCHGQNFERVSMGKSKVVKDMSLKEIINSLKGYKDGSYGDSMKHMMTMQVKGLSDKEIEQMAMLIKVDAGTQTERASEHAKYAAVLASGGHVDLNIDSSDELRIEMEDLGNRNSVSERALGLRKTDLYTDEGSTGSKTDYSRPSPGSSKKFERAFSDAPPMIPHSVEGLLPISKENNQCLGCHLPEIASAVGSTPIPASHFTNYRPDTKEVGTAVVKEGKWLIHSNTSDVVIAKASKSDDIYQGRFNCNQCHAPQSKTRTDVSNTFEADFHGLKGKVRSSLADAMNEGIE